MHPALSTQRSPAPQVMAVQVLVPSPLQTTATLNVAPASTSHEEEIGPWA
jgi:hypothetical protein